MGKIIVSAEISLDGAVSNPKLWEKAFNYHSADVTAYLHKLLFTPDALLMGRLTYEVFSVHWPQQSGKEADHINALPKHVASTSLKGPLAWNASLLEGDTAAALRKLKEDKVLLQYGIGPLTQFMVQQKLVDEVYLLVFPFTIGEKDGSVSLLGNTAYRLIESQVFESGAVLVKYQLA